MNSINTVLDLSDSIVGYLGIFTASEKLYLSRGSENIKQFSDVCVMCVHKIYYVFMEKVVATFHTLVVGKNVF